MLNNHLYFESSCLPLLTLCPELCTVHSVRSKLSLIVTSSNLQFDSNNYNEKSVFGIGIKPTKNINLTIPPFGYSDDKTHTANTDTFDAISITSQLQTQQSRISPYKHIRLKDMPNSNSRC